MESDASPAELKGSSFFIGLLRDWGIALIVVVLVFVGFNVFFGSGKPPSGPANDFTLADLDGQEWTLSEADDHVIVLNFWFTDCPPCRKEIPDLVRWQKENPDVPIIGIHVDPRKPPGVVKRVSQQLGINYKVLDDRQATVARSYNVTNYPTTVLLVDGQVVDAKVGLITHERLDAMVTAAR